jgi:hypothetical protein
MHQIVATVEGVDTVLVETPFCESAFDYYCYYLREYPDNQLRIEGDCSGDPNGGEY